MTEDRPERLLGREFLTLAASTMLFFAAMGAANPVLPKFAADELGASDTVVGSIVGIFAVSALLLRPFFGRLGDRRGARLLMIMGCLIGAAGMVGYTAVGSVPAALAARLPQGAAQAAVMTGATTLAIDLAPDHRRAEAASYILVAFHIGLGLGPLLGEVVLEQWSFDAVWLVLAVLMVLGALVATALPTRASHLDVAPSPLLHPSGMLPGLVVAMGMMGFISFSTFVPLYAEEIDVERVGPLFVVASATIALIRVLAGKVPDRLGPIVTSTIALGLVMSGAVLLATWASPLGLYLGTPVLASGGALLMPALVAVAVDGVEPHRRSSALATFTMFLDLAVGVTGPLFGLIASGTGYRGTFVAGGVAALVSLVVLRTTLAPRWVTAHPRGRLAESAPPCLTR